ncbi:glycoside hydrolase family 2 TIM barrel-domain containing protein [Plebeiibacterium marinum]|uniref:Beta-glucuronidase n=1 Tax=Plebeiibacterium marinum TaxID=2992111 RepID=A0AAE3MB79_9BACT|nr:glycoside hydrolase family 2 TIM barrel-domain containing protein [Plebeiobacterium marinum]MCW3804523.1 hypothetical protein [Plebeiobacterium marinum]
MVLRTTIYILLFAISMGLNAQEFSKANPKDIALFPQRNEVRELKKISGIWKFKKDAEDKGVEEQWFNGLKDFRSIAVPGSWNEQFTDMKNYRDWVWYETTSFIPERWKDEKVYIRIGEASYAAKVWINGKTVGEHAGGHVPFSFNISPMLNFGAENRITIQVENIFEFGRMPEGGFSSQAIADLDYFPYGGINRDVYLYTVPQKAHIKDITVVPSFKGTKGLMEVIVEQEGDVEQGSITVSGNGHEIDKNIQFVDGLAKISIKIPDVRLWSPEDPYLYNVKVVLGEKEEIDSYSLQTGVRTVSVNENQILLNDKPIFLKGFGKQEDFPLFGRGTNNPVIVTDMELMDWVGANSFRTAYYPFDEEYYNLADKKGFLVIAESPAVGLFGLNDTAQIKSIEGLCNQYMEEMILRDKNHPSIIMWGLANEPMENTRRKEGDTSKEEAYKMFADYMQRAKDLDPTRLVMYLGDSNGPSDWYDVADVICLNRYEGWYKTNGRINEGVQNISNELDQLHTKFKKPCILIEFGAAALPGAHAINPEMFTEDYQVELIRAYMQMAKHKDFISGVMLWNFADFKTTSSIIRMGGYNYKGVFTRDRRPKAAARYLKAEWKSDKE